MNRAEFLDSLSDLLDRYEEAVEKSRDALEAGARELFAREVKTLAEGAALRSWMGAEELSGEEEDLRDRLRDLIADEGLSEVAALLAAPVPAPLETRIDGYVRALTLEQAVAPALVETAPPAPGAELGRSWGMWRGLAASGLPTIAVLGAIFGWFVPRMLWQDPVPVPRPVQAAFVTVAETPRTPPVQNLRVDSLEVRLAALGPLARTELHFRLSNSGPERADGKLPLLLPEDATVLYQQVTRDGKSLRLPPESRLVELPALDPFERVEVDVVLSGVYPADSSGKRRFPLPVAGLGTLPLLRVRAECRPLPARPLEIEGWLDGMRREQEVGARPFTHDQVHEDFHPEGRVALEVAVHPDEPREARLVAGEVEAVVLRPEVPPPFRPEPARYVFLVDRSASMRTRLPAAARRLGEVLRELAEQRPDVPVELRAFDIAEEQLYSGEAGKADVDTLVTTVLDSGAFGATDLRRVLAETVAAPGEGRLAVVLLSDGIATFGEAEPEADWSRASLYVLDLGGSFDSRTLGTPEAYDGDLLGDELSPVELVEALRRHPRPRLRLTGGPGLFAGPSRGLPVRPGEEQVLFWQGSTGAATALTWRLDAPRRKVVEKPVRARRLVVTGLDELLLSQAEKRLQVEAERRGRERDRRHVARTRPPTPAPTRFLPPTPPAPSASPTPTVELVLGDRSSRVRPGSTGSGGPLIQTLHPAPEWTRRSPPPAELVRDPRLALVYAARAGRHEDMLESARELQRKSPDDPLAHELLAMAHAARDQSPIDQRVLTSLVEFAPGDVRQVDRAGWLALWSGHAELAAALFQRALALVPGDASASAGLALTGRRFRMNLSGLRVGLYGLPGARLHLVRPGKKELRTPSKLHVAELEAGEHVLGVSRRGGADFAGGVLVVERRPRRGQAQIKVIPFVLAPGEGAAEAVRVLSVPGGDVEVWR